MKKISLDEKFALFDEHWRPKTIAALNGQEVKLVKVKGEFPWHHHANEDEFFMVWKGQFRVEFRDRVVTLAPANAWWCRAAPSIAPAPTRRPGFCASSRRIRSIPAMSAMPPIRHRAVP